LLSTTGVILSLSELSNLILFKKSKHKTQTKLKSLELNLRKFHYILKNIKMAIIEILTYISIFSGGILILLLFLSILGGLDLDFDFPNADSGDIDSSGGIGIVKAALTFISVSSWIIKVVLATKANPYVAIFAGLIGGYLSVLLIKKIFTLLLTQTENTNWEFSDAIHQSGKVYLKIPKEGLGIIQVLVNGVTRELKAKSIDNTEILTGESVFIHEVDDDLAIVKKQ